MNNNWQLIGLHHLGDKQVEVPGEEGNYLANEGIEIHEIIDDISRQRREGPRTS